jgi:hypothetical protein
MTSGRLRRVESQVGAIVAIAVSLALAHAPVGAQPPDAKDGAGTAAPAPAPDNARLDELLWSKDYSKLGQALNSTRLDRRLDWLKDRLLGGGTVFLAPHYVNALWMAGVREGETNPNKDMRVTAGLIALYALQVMSIDGARCEDSSAPGDRAVQFLTNFRPVNDHLRKQPIETRLKVVDVALKMERSTAPKRKDDDWLCRGGLAEMAARARAAKPVEAPPRVKGVREFYYPPAPGWSPKFLPSEKYALRQEQIRASMREQLLNLVK